MRILSVFAMAPLLFFSSIGFAGSSRSIKCSDARVETIWIRPNFGTVVNFPLKPDNVLLGSEKQFGIVYVKNDVALTALIPNASTNMFVYLLGRRCAFRLVTSQTRHDEIVRVQDADEVRLKVKIQ